LRQKEWESSTVETRPPAPDSNTSVRLQALSSAEDRERGSSPMRRIQSSVGGGSSRYSV
jgi:hypothetical protein